MMKPETPTKIELRMQIEELERNESLMDGALSAKQEIIESQSEEIAQLRAELETARRVLSKLTEQRNQLCLDSSGKPRQHSLEILDAEIAAIERKDT